jgi:hypothetical protein
MGKVVAGAIALVGWFALALQFYLILTIPENQSLSVAERIVRFFSFFTILTNTIVAVTAIAIAFFPSTPIGKFLAKPTSQAAVAVYIAIVGIVYSLFLRAVWDPDGLQAVADHALHDVVPLAYVIYWILFAPKLGIGWSAPFLWLAYPLVYVAYSLTRGAIVGWYPYWFVDVTQLGYPTALTNTAFVLFAFLIVGFIVVAIARLFVKAGTKTALQAEA